LDLGSFGREGGEISTECMWRLRKRERERRKRCKIVIVLSDGVVCVRVDNWFCGGAEEFVSEMDVGVRRRVGVGQKRRVSLSMLGWNWYEMLCGCIWVISCGFNHGCLGEGEKVVNTWGGVWEKERKW
jgi:hypothetical protein